MAVIAMSGDEIDDTRVKAELTRLFHAYEAALMRNDAQALSDFFWADERMTRYGIADVQKGHRELTAFRAAQLAPSFTRQLHDLRIVTFGHDLAVAQVEFTRSDTTLRGFQTQTWVRLGEAWKIVAAHVSMIPFEG